MKIKEKYYRFAEKGQQIQRVNRFFVTEYLIFMHLFCLCSGHQEQKEYVLWTLRHLSV